MTEEEWLTCKVPEPMLEFLRGRANERKLRLFAAACCRRIWHLVPDGTPRVAIIVGERLADDPTQRATRRSASVAFTTHNSLAMSPLDRAASSACCFAVASNMLRVDIRPPAEACATEASRAVAFQAVPDTNAVMIQAPATANPAWLAAQRGEQVIQAVVLRDIIGNPFRSVMFNATWRTPTVTALAEAVYEDRVLPSGLFDNQHLDVIADALEEAGCDNAAFLGHLRSGGGHVRGCWVIDQVLGKE